MERATISQTKNRLSALLDRVRHGETILILDRNTPIARLEPAQSAGGEGDDRLARLERAGLLRRGAEAAVSEILREAPPIAIKGADIVRAVLKERAESR